MFIQSRPASLGPEAMQTQCKAYGQLLATAVVVIGLHVKMYMGTEAPMDINNSLNT